MAALFYWCKQNHIYTRTLHTYNILNVMNTLVKCVNYTMEQYFQSSYITVHVCAHMFMWIWLLMYVTKTQYLSKLM
jgi:hypothetical protein